MPSSATGHARLPDGTTLDAPGNGGLHEPAATIHVDITRVDTAGGERPHQRRIADHRSSTPQHELDVGSRRLKQRLAGAVANRWKDREIGGSAHSDPSGILEPQDIGRDRSDHRHQIVRRERCACRCPQFVQEVSRTGHP
jgi:hypothetical protein